MNQSTMNTMFSSKTGIWETPQDLFDSLNQQYNFTLDTAALPENTKVPKHYFTPDIDGLNQPWYGCIWCNPPYGREIGEWVKKAYNETRMSNCRVVMLLPARTDTQWFHNYIYHNEFAHVQFIRGRLKFGNSTNSAPFPSMIVVFDPWAIGEGPQAPIYNRIYYGSSINMQDYRDLYTPLVIPISSNTESTGDS